MVRWRQGRLRGRHVVPLDSTNDRPGAIYDARETTIDHTLFSSISKCGIGADLECVCVDGLARSLRDLRDSCDSNQSAWQGVQAEPDSRESFSQCFSDFNREARFKNPQRISRTEPGAT